MELLYICDLKGEWFDFIYIFSQLLPGLVAGALSRYVLCGVVSHTAVHVNSTVMVSHNFVYVNSLISRTIASTDGM